MPLNVRLGLFERLQGETNYIGNAVYITGETFTASTIDTGYPLYFYLFIVWILGVLFYSLKIIINEILFRQRIRRKIPVNLDLTIEKIKSRLKFYRPVKCYLSNSIPYVYTTGIFRYKIILPIESMKWPEEELTGILAHEITHQKRKDMIYQIVQMVIQVMFFFHPAVWWLNNKINLEREKICDSSALSITGNNQKEYSRMLLNHLERILTKRKASYAASGFLLSKKSLIERFEYLLTFKEGNMLKLTKANFFALLISFFTVLSVSFLFCSSEEQKIAEKQSNLQKNAEFVDYDVPPRPLNKIAPNYPQELKDNQMQGDVWAKALVKTDGRLDIPNVEFIKASIIKIENEDTTLVDNQIFIDNAKNAVLKALEGYTFEPAKKDGKAIEVWVSLPFKFRLNLDEQTKKDLKKAEESQ